MKNLLQSPADVKDGLESNTKMHEEAQTEKESEDQPKNNSALLKNILENTRKEKQPKDELQKQQETQPDSGPTNSIEFPAVKSPKAR